MRLNRAATIRATNELLSILAEHPEGLTTSWLSGTSQFHGERTLRNRQIIRLLRATGRARESTVGFGMRTATLWKLKEEPSKAATPQVEGDRAERLYRAKDNNVRDCLATPRIDAKTDDWEKGVKPG